MHKNIFTYIHTLKITYIEKMFVLKNYLYSKVACVLKKLSCPKLLILINFLCWGNISIENFLDLKNSKLLVLKNYFCWKNLKFENCSSWKKNLVLKICLIWKSVCLQKKCLTWKMPYLEKLFNLNFFLSCKTTKIEIFLVSKNYLTWKIA